MDNLLFSLNATLPVFLMMVLGFILHAIGIIDDEFASKLNKFVFVVTLPVLLFHELATTDFIHAWDGRFVLFCFVITLISILIVWLISFVISNRSERGEFIQVAYRSSAALLGIAYMQNIYGNASMAPLMIVGSVPLYNIIAVIILTLSSDSNDNLKGRGLVNSTFKSVITNPILLGVFFGLCWSLTGWTIPEIADKTLQNLGGITTPLGLLALGASIDPKRIRGVMYHSILAVFIKLIGLCALFLPIAVWFGFRDSQLIAILIMLGSPTTVSCYIMAKNMGHDGALTSNSVMLATILSAFTLTFWIWILRTFSLL